MALIPKGVSYTKGGRPTEAIWVRKHKLKALDFFQQLADGTVRLSFDQSRFRTPLEYDEPRSRSPIDLHQPFRQPTILLRDRPVSQCSSSRNLAPFPRSRRDLGPEFQGVRTQSKGVSYTKGGRLTEAIWVRKHKLKVTVVKTMTMVLQV